MANASSALDYSQRRADWLAQAVDDGTYDDIVVTLKVDAVGEEAAATQIEVAAGQLWSNLVDDVIYDLLQFRYKSTKVWRVASTTARDALGSDDGLVVKDLCWVDGDSEDRAILYYCSFVGGTDASEWVSAAAVGPGSAEQHAVPKFDGTSGSLFQGTDVIIDDNNNITIPGAIKTTPLAVAYAASISLDVAEDNDFDVAALTGNITIDWTNPAAGRSGKIELLQDGTGGRTLTINVPSGGSILRAYDSAGAAIPVSFPSTAANARVTVYYEFISSTVVKLTPVRFGA